MSKIKTVVVVSIVKMHEVAGSENPAMINDIFPIDGQVRLNMQQKTGSCPDTYREWVNNTFAANEIKSMY